MCSIVRAKTIREWTPVFSLMMSAFIFNTSELIPVGLLSNIGSDFHASESKMGMIISVYAWVVAIMSLPLMVAVSGMAYRKMMLMLVGGFALFQFASSLSTGYEMLMFSRVGVACMHAVFWGVVPLLAVKSAPEGKENAALGILVSGGAIAMIVGLPLGRIIGLYLSWRMTFCILGLFAVLIFVVLALWFPKIENSGRFPIMKLPSLFKNKLLASIYVYTVLIVTSYFTAYAYIEPFLGQVGKLNELWVTGILVMMGLAGLTGSFIFARFFGKMPRKLFVMAGFVTLFALAMLQPSAVSLASVSIVCFLLAASNCVFNLINQELIVNRIDANESTVAMATYSGLFNLGIGTGTYIGGIAINEMSISAIGFVGACIAVLGVAFGCAALLRKI